MTLRYVIISQKNWPDIFMVMGILHTYPIMQIPHSRMSLHRIFNGSSSFFFISGLFGWEHKVLKHQSRIRMLAPDLICTPISSEMISPCRTVPASLFTYSIILCDHPKILNLQIVPNLLTLIHSLC